MALRFLIQAMSPAERMTAPLLISRRCAGVQAATGAPALPERPKKPLTGYVQFVAATIPILKQQMPGAKSSEMLVKASGLWKELDDVTKKRYNDEYAASKAKWMAASAQFEASLSTSTRDQLLSAERRARDDRREQRQRRQRRQQLTDHQKPRKPANAFMLYLQDRQPSRGDQSQKEFVVAIAKEWAAKTDAAKAPYVKRYTDAKQKYERELAVWERQMIKQGRADLVRSGSQPVIDVEEVTRARR